MKDSENWERLAGILLALGMILPAAIAAKMDHPIQTAGQVVLAVCVLPAIAGALLMWRVKAAQRAADRLLGKNHVEEESRTPTEKDDLR